MRPLAFSLCLIAAVALGQARLRYPGDRPGSTGAPVEIARVVALGDSITQGSGITGVTDPYPAKLNNLLGVRWDVVNHGYSGDTVAQMRTRWTNDIRGKKAWRYFIFLGGVNDLRNGTSANTIFTTISATLDEARADGIIVVLFTVTPWKAFVNWSAARQTETESLNALLLNYCATYPSQARCRDTYDVLNDPADAALLLAAHNSGDGLHPDQSGMDILADEAKAAIAP